MEDCKVCKQLIKEKHRRDIWWKICCIIFGELDLILGILYFVCGYVEEINDVEIQNSHLQNNGDNGSIIIGGENIGNTIQGTITDKDYTPIICITVIAGDAVLVAGGVIIAHNVKKDK